MLARPGFRCLRCDHIAMKWARIPAKLRIAWSVTPASGATIHPECARAVEETGRLLEDAGHRLTEDRPHFDWDEYLEKVHVIWAAYNVLSADFAAQTMGRKPGPDNLEAVTWACYEDGKRFSATDLLDSMAQET